MRLAAQLDKGGYDDDSELYFVYKDVVESSGEFDEIEVL
jgi:hypothetical protein